MKSWISDCKKMIHLDFHMPEFPKDAINSFDAQKLVAQLKQAKVDAVAIFAKDHFGMSFYDTEVGHKHQGLKQHDFLGETIAEAHKQGIKVLIYLSTAWDRYNIINNPDWRQCKINGEPLLENAEWEWGCVNTPYKEESLFPQIRELCEKYPADGFFFDGVMYQEGGCFCKYCQEKYNSINQTSLVADANLDGGKKHKAFMARSMENFIRESTEIIKSYHPNSVTCMNASWELGQDYRVVDNTDFMIIEAQPAHLQAGGYELLSLQSRYARTQGKPFQIVTVRFAEGWGEMTLKEEQQLKYEFSVIASNGGIVCCGDQVYPNGTLEQNCYDRLEKAFGYIDTKMEAFGSKHIKEVAVYYQNGKDFPFSVTDFQHSLLGLHKCLVESHIQYDIIDYTKLNTLSEYKLLIVPAEIMLSKEELEKMKEYALCGGNLLFGGNTIWSADVGANLSELLGIVGEEPFPYICGYYNPVDTESQSKMPLLVKGRWNKIKPVEAEVIADLYLPITASAPPHRGFRSAYPPASRQSFYPAATMNRCGKGKALYIATDIAKTYWDYSHIWLKRILHSSINSLIDCPILITNAPSITETNITQSGNNIYLHIVTGLMNHQVPTSYAPIEDDFTIANISFEISLPDIKAATILSKERLLNCIRMENGYYCFKLDLDEPYIIVKFELQ